MCIRDRNDKLNPPSCWLVILWLSLPLGQYDWHGQPLQQSPPHVVCFIVVPLNLTFDRGVLPQDLRDGGLPGHGPGNRDQEVIHPVQYLQQSKGWRSYRTTLYWSWNYKTKQKILNVIKLEMDRCLWIYLSTRVFTYILSNVLLFSLWYLKIYLNFDKKKGIR